MNRYLSGGLSGTPGSLVASNSDSRGLNSDTSAPAAFHESFTSDSQSYSTSIDDPNFHGDLSSSIDDRPVVIFSGSSKDSNEDAAASQALLSLNGSAESSKISVLASLLRTHIPPNPITYLKMAAICRSMYHEFMSDAAWRYLNPHGRESNVAAAYCSRMADAPRSLQLRHIKAWRGNHHQAWLDSLHDEPLDDPDTSLGVLVRQAPYFKPHKYFDWPTMVCAVHLNGLCMAYATPELQDNMELARVAVRQNAMALEYVSQRLCSHPELIEIAIASNEAAVQYVDAFTATQTQVTARLIVKYQGDLLRFTPFSNDPDVVLEAVRNSGSALQYASPRLRDNTAVVIEAMSKDGLALEFVSARLKDNREVVLTAVRRSGLALQFASPELQDDEEVVITALNNDPRALEFASERFSGDETLQIQALNLSVQLEVAVPFIQNRDLVLHAVRENPNIFRYIRAGFQDDYEIALVAMDGGSILLSYASYRLQDDEKFVHAALWRSPGAIRFATHRVRCELCGAYRISQWHPLQAINNRASFYNYTDLIIATGVQITFDSIIWIGSKAWRLLARRT